MTSDTLYLGDYTPGSPTEPMLAYTLEGVRFSRSDLAQLPTMRVAAAPAASRIHETPTRKLTRVIPAIGCASGLPAKAKEVVRVGPPEHAMCGHDTPTPLWEEGSSYCPACWARGHCRADYCAGTPAWGDRCGYWWCAEHEGGAVLMTLGSDLGYPTLTFDSMTIWRAKENWLYFARSTCFKRHDLLRAAILHATRARLLQPGETQRPSGVSTDSGEVQS